MSETNPYLHSVRTSPGIRLSVLFGSFFVLLLITSVISAGINSLSIGDERDQALLSAFLQCVLAFCIPAVLLARFCSKEWINWLKLSSKPTIRALCGVVIVYLLSLPAMEWLIVWNSNLHLPESMSSLEQLLRSWEETSESTSEMLLDAHGIIPVLFGVLVIGVVTGFSEELFFRGGLQGIFRGANIGVTGSVWLAAFIFSFMHFQFFGFLPRLFMGAFFGYLLIWTRSIWVPVFAHILNNSIVVITSAIKGNATSSILNQGNSDIYFGNNLIVTGSVILTLMFLWICKDKFFQSRQTRKRWPESQLPPVSEK